MWNFTAFYKYLSNDYVSFIYRESLYQGTIYKLDKTAGETYSSNIPRAI